MPYSHKKIAKKAYTIVYVIFFSYLCTRFGIIPLLHKITYI